MNITPEVVTKLMTGDLAKLLRGVIDKCEEKENDFKKTIVGLEETRKIIEAEFENRMLNEGVDKVSTPHGTVSFKITKSASCGDWGSLYTYIVDNHRFDLLHKRVSTDAVNLILEDTGSLPPGVALNSVRKVNFRRT
jgi:hypothetical protein